MTADAIESSTEMVNVVISVEPGATRLFVGSYDSWRMAVWAAAAVPEAHEGASQASAAGAILDFIDKKQDQIIAAGIDPASFFADLLTEARTLIQSAQDHNINAGNAA